MIARDYGYTPTNIRRELRAVQLAGQRNPRGWLAGELDVHIDSVNRWCVAPDTSPERHQSPSFVRWIQIVSLCRARAAADKKQNEG